MPNTSIVCLTPDKNYCAAAAFAAERLLTHGLSLNIDVALLCTPDDVDAAIAGQLGERVQIFLHDFGVANELSIEALPLGRHISPAAYRRLLLPHILPQQYTRILYLDCDTLCVGPGIEQLLTLDLDGRAFAAALDMIRLKDFKSGPLSEEFQHYRTTLGLEADAPYFNSGVLLIDRAQWIAHNITEHAVAFARNHLDQCQFHDQSALNAVTQGQWAPLSPRFNFMGDFLLLNLMCEIDPVILHFVNDPKPWQQDCWNGPAWMQALYEREAIHDPRSSEAPLTASFQSFRQRLLDFLAAQQFADGLQLSS